jgi:hypothetical protein
MKGYPSPAGRILTDPPSRPCITVLCKAIGFTLIPRSKTCPGSTSGFALWDQRGKIIHGYNRNYGSGVYQNDYEGITPIWNADTGILKHWSQWRLKAL